MKTNKPKISKSSVKLAAAAPEIATLESEENNNIKKVMVIMKEHNITALEAKNIYDSSIK